MSSIANNSFDGFFNKINSDLASSGNSPARSGEKHAEISAIVKSNLQSIADLRGTQNIKLSFSNDGKIVHDKHAYLPQSVTNLFRGLAGPLKQKIQYSNFDEDITNISKFLNFTKAYYETHYSGPKEKEELEKLIPQVEEGLNDLKKSYKDTKKIKIIDDSIASLKDIQHGVEFTNASANKIIKGSFFEVGLLMNNSLLESKNTGEEDKFNIFLNSIEHLDGDTSAIKYKNSIIDDFKHYDIIIPNNLQLSIATELVQQEYSKLNAKEDSKGRRKELQDAVESRIGDLYEKIELYSQGLTTLTQKRELRAFLLEKEFPLSFARDSKLKEVDKAEADNKAKKSAVAKTVMEKSLSFLKLVAAGGAAYSTGGFTTVATAMLPYVIETVKSGFEAGKIELPSGKALEDYNKLSTTNNPLEVFKLVGEIIKENEKQGNEQIKDVKNTIDQLVKLLSKSEEKKISEDFSNKNEEAGN